MILHMKKIILMLNYIRDGKVHNFFQVDLVILFIKYQMFIKAFVIHEVIYFLQIIKQINHFYVHFSFL